MKNDVEIDFELYATTVSPKEISRLTGVDADVCLLKGERNKELCLPRENRWSIRSHVISDSVEDHWNYLEKMLSGKEEILKNLAETGTVKITLIVNSSMRIPPLSIPPNMSAFAAFLNANIEIDHLQH